MNPKRACQILTHPLYFVPGPLSLGTLLDFNLFGRFADYLLQFRQFDGQDTVLHFRVDLFFVHIFRQTVFLLVVGVRELAAQIVRVFVFLFVFELVLDGDAEVVIFVDMNAAVVFLYARRCQSSI